MGRHVRGKPGLERADLDASLLDQPAYAREVDNLRALHRAGKISEWTSVNVLPSDFGILFVAGGTDGELYLNGEALTASVADQLTVQLPDLASDIACFRQIREHWHDRAPVDRSGNPGRFRD
jgi:hypothetical protein